VVDPLNDRALGAEILNQVEGFLAQQLAQAGSQSDVGPSEAVDGLLGVPDYEQLAWCTG
jgi:hypothetical protein